MKVFFGGVRGSVPCPGANYLEFGGHTTCLLVTGDRGELVLLDTGSGVREVNPILQQAGGRKLLLLLTHLHLDHVLGLPLLGPLGDRSWTVDIAGAGRKPGDLAAALGRIVAPPLWPVPLADMGARIGFPDIGAEAMTAAGPAHGVDGLEIRGTRVTHPNGCMAWRIDETDTGAALVFATDLEWSAADAERQQELIRLCSRPRPADLLVMEGHFTAEELPRHSGWGHSSGEEAVAVAEAAQVARLVVTHHDPDKDDAVLKQVEDRLRSRSEIVSLARQGETISLDGKADQR
jgi:ribonuclease BN (tRNA processing enzyme)